MASVGHFNLNTIHGYLLRLLQRLSRLDGKLTPEAEQYIEEYGSSAEVQNEDNEVANIVAAAEAIRSKYSKSKVKAEGPKSAETRGGPKSAETSGGPKSAETSILKEARLNFGGKRPHIKTSGAEFAAVTNLAGSSQSGIRKGKPSCERMRRSYLELLQKKLEKPDVISPDYGIED